MNEKWVSDTLEVCRYLLTIPSIGLNTGELLSVGLESLDELMQHPTALMADWMLKVQCGHISLVRVVGKSSIHVWCYYHKEDEEKLQQWRQYRSIMSMDIQLK